MTGLDNIFIQTALREQRPGFFVISGCPWPVLHERYLRRVKQAAC